MAMDESHPDLPTITLQARRFGKTRQAHAIALAEDYVELIDDLRLYHKGARATDIARRLGVSHATVIKALARLQRDSLVVSQPYRGVSLTQAGMDMVARVRARHRLLVNV